MKYFLLLATVIVSTNLLTACQTTTPSSDTPSLGGMQRQTSRSPSPSNFQRNNMMDASRMMTPGQ